MENDNEILVNNVTFRLMLENQRQKHMNDFKELRVSNQKLVKTKNELIERIKRIDNIIDNHDNEIDDILNKKLSNIQKLIDILNDEENE